MAADFRTLLVTLDSDDPVARRYDDIRIGDWFLLSVQTRPLYDDSPMELPDPATCDAFALSLMTQGGVISYGSWGVWEELCHKPWAAHFRQELPLLLVAEDVPAAAVQEILDDLTEFAAANTPPVNKKKAQAAQDAA
ncbi:hypothetical protein [Megalodesulfovibrio gigas]|uniref:Uncharacterized protein n=1 Tax=Megalodesulfovibrio gigas (strain ATCC 19364 / DSM 1382 / NCIMB 9332 / VKM B-1759) TaxID=1121448 RepID=T2G885_MEGG1|nr:hypothetical protein [Megalodesulfovibrio gigas]AGW12082.1 hypothetical protein DGI_0145 [Megalodesulfovibrio gigas DSM 1382 = ATCC 19364]